MEMVLEKHLDIQQQISMLNRAVYDLNLVFDVKTSLLLSHIAWKNI